MANPLAGHLWSVATLALAAAVALGVEFAASGTTARPSASASPVATDEIEGFLAPIRREFGASRPQARVERDPLTPGRMAASVARPSPVYTSTRQVGRRLTAILIADDRQVAVLDDAVVGIGDRLPDGARVDEIRGDRVWVVESNGRRKMLTLTPGRP